MSKWTNSKWATLFALVIVVAMVVSACAPATPEVVEVEKIVTQVVEVEKEVEKIVTQVVEVEKEVTVVETVEVEKQVEVEVPGGARGVGGTLNILYWQAVSMLNTYLAQGTKDFEAASLIIEPLARYDEVGNLVPFLAEEIPTLANGGVSEDLKSITWKLKPGVLWADGTPLTAEDAAFTIDFCMHPDLGCVGVNHYRDIESVEVVDDLTLKINFTVPKPFPYGPLVSEEAPVIQKAQFENCMGAAAQECSEQNFAPIGTGPYKVKEFRPNDVVTYEVNENYRDPNKPYFSEVIFKGGGDAASAARAVLETGEVDYAWNLQVDPGILNQMEQSGGLGKLVVAFGSSVECILPNFTNPDPALGDLRSEWTEEDPNPHPFITDPTVRRALSLAIDRNTLAQVGYGLFGKATCNKIPAPAIYASTANDECLTQDLDEANRILDEAGILDTDGDGIREKDGVPLKILYQTSTNAVRQDTQALVKQMWSQIGVDTELRNIDAAVFFGGDPASPDTYSKFYADVEMFTNNFAGVDPETYMGNWRQSQICASANQWGLNNIQRWYNPEYNYEDLVTELAVTGELEKRAELVKQMNDILVQDYAFICLIHRGDVSAHANSLLGVRMNTWDSELWNIADWTRGGQ